MHASDIARDAASTGVQRGVVLRTEGLDVIVEVGTGRELVCDVLATTHSPLLLLAPGDRVLVFAPEPSDDRGVVLGRIGLSHAGAPSRMVIEAGEELVLRVGDGSITIRKDGKVLIKGQDLVSHARRMNRIKGGAVSIN